MGTVSRSRVANKIKGKRYISCAIVQLMFGAMGESAVKSHICMRSTKHKNNAAMSMSGKQLSDIFYSSPTLSDRRKQNDSGAGAVSASRQRITDRPTEH